MGSCACALSCTAAAGHRKNHTCYPCEAVRCWRAWVLAEGSMPVVPAHTLCSTRRSLAASLRTAVLCCACIRKLGAMRAGVVGGARRRGRAADLCGRRDGRRSRLHRPLPCGPPCLPRAVHDTRWQERVPADISRLRTLLRSWAGLLCRPLEQAAAAAVQVGLFHQHSSSRTD